MGHRESCTDSKHRALTGACVTAHTLELAHDVQDNQMFTAELYGLYGQMKLGL